MGVLTVEGIIEHGEVKLDPGVRLPDHARVYVVIPGVEVERTVHIYTPRLVHPEQARDFEMEIVEEQSHAGV